MVRRLNPQRGVQRAPFRWDSAEVSAHKHADGIAEQVKKVRHLLHFRAVEPFFGGVVSNAFKTTRRTCFTGA